ncbi:MAG: type I-E CRISPR-associated endonuclease Cas1 [Myxococcales bacterium]|nr:type I-E CRISPR-associated endonuclease Cas1 [Myxococcales bacterium]
MIVKDLHELPKVRDGLSFLYVEHARLDREGGAVAIYDENGVTPAPAAALALLLLGPGTAITHEAVKTLAENGCTILWCGEGAVRCYAQGMGETRKADKLLRQAELYADPTLRLQVAMRMYRMRFVQPLPADLTIEQLRGMEGVRVRQAYAEAAQRYGVIWSGRNYQRGDWTAADPVNRALSAANSCLYGLCHAAIVSAGYSPAIGFIHTGKQLSFVYDIADLYKMDVSVPIAFRVAGEGVAELEREVRRLCRDAFREVRLLDRVVPDLARALDIDESLDETTEKNFDADAAEPGGLWDPSAGTLEGGMNYGGDDSGEHPAEPAGPTDALDDRTAGGSVRRKDERDGS